MKPAIHFHPEAYSTGGPKLMGRNAAGESFLRGFLRHSRADGFFVDVRDPSHAEGFASAARAAGRTEPVRSITAANLGDLAQAEVLYQPDPMLGAQAWRRAAFGHGSWSLCGITHTTASAGVMDGIADLLVAPVQPWDALICTSHAVKDNVERLLNGQRRHLRERLGASRVVMPQLPVIPLGIHTEDFVFSADQRGAARAELGVTEATLVVLFMGRLSFHAKAHPLAMYQALETAARATGREVLLIECGWHANDFIASAYDEAGRFACPGVRVAVRDGRLPQVRQGCWAAADIFCSLSDNIQETFGLVPLEAMAAGLPVIVSDWDGYRETVRDLAHARVMALPAPADSKDAAALLADLTRQGCTNAPLLARCWRGIAGEDGFVESSVKAAQEYLASPDRTKDRKASERFAGQVRAWARTIAGAAIAPAVVARNRRRRMVFSFPVIGFRSGASARRSGGSPRRAGGRRPD